MILFRCRIIKVGISIYVFLINEREVERSFLGQLNLNRRHFFLSKRALLDDMTDPLGYRMSSLSPLSA